MKVHSFVAESAPQAVAQIRAQLGPEAVVLNVRQLPSEGISRLWQKPRIEVLAYAPEPAAPQSNPLADIRQELDDIRQRISRKNPPSAPESPAEELISPEAWGRKKPSGKWKVESLLEDLGFLPIGIQKVIDELYRRHGSQPDPSLGLEMQWTRSVLSNFWEASQSTVPAAPGANIHVFAGSPGSGKTTALCKWLAQSVLIENRVAHVWRLDGRVANTAESLSVYGEILGVPVDREWTPLPASLADIGFVDLPGAAWADKSAIADLGRQIGSLPPRRLHLVLNAAYEMQILLAQVRAFSALPLDDIIVTHLDEEARPGKLWNLVLGTKYPIRFLSAGQNVPGEFSEATAEKVLGRHFPGK